MRVARLDADSAVPAVGELLAGLPPMQLFGLAAHAEDAFAPWLSYLQALHSSLDLVDSSERRNAGDFWAADYRACRVCRRWTLLGCSGGAALGFLSMFGTRFVSRRMSPSGI